MSVQAAIVAIINKGLNNDNLAEKIAEIGCYREIAGLWVTYEASNNCDLFSDTDEYRVFHMGISHNLSITDYPKPLIDATFKQVRERGRDGLSAYKHWLF